MTTTTTGKLAFLDRSRTVAPAGYSRWLVPPAALAVHLSIGQAYAFSILKTPLEEKFDASHTTIGWIFSIAIVMLGLSAAFGGTWMERNGPRKAMALAALCWSTGFAVAALGVATSQLWLVFLGYGFIGGIGLGIGYISPVSTLIKWFPDRPGLATGLAIMGFGGGAMLASPLSQAMLSNYRPTEVESLVPTLLTLGAIYAVLMTLGAIVVRVPEKGWKPEGYVAKKNKRSLSTGGQVSASNSTRTWQFYALWIVLFTNVTAGIGVLHDAKPMILEFFTVTPAAAAGYVGLLSLANMAGRLAWSSLSDVIGRKNTYIIYLGVGMLAYTSTALFGDKSVGLFVALTFLIVSFYGGGFATVPAYLKDLFGEFQVGAIHGRLLTAWAAAGVAGPYIINSIHDRLQAAGETGSDLYRQSLLTMVAILAVGFVANIILKQVDAKFHEKKEA